MPFCDELGYDWAMWILIPAKRPSLAKSRLSPVLDHRARALLARFLLVRLLTIISGVDGVTDVLVISADAGLRSISELFGFHSLPDPVVPTVHPHTKQEATLNASLEAGREYAMAHGAKSLLVLPTDLPTLSKEALATFLSAARMDLQPPRIVMTYDRQGKGTNALFQSPPDAIPFSFGVDSGARHRQLAAQAAIPFIVVHQPELAFDLDLPQDLSCSFFPNASICLLLGL